MWLNLNKFHSIPRLIRLYNNFLKIFKIFLFRVNYSIIITAEAEYIIFIVIIETTIIGVQFLGLVPTDYERIVLKLRNNIEIWLILIHFPINKTV